MRINEEKLRAKLESGAVTIQQLRQALAFEMQNASIVTLPTLGVASKDLASREASARRELDALEADAALNIPVLQRLLAENDAEPLNTCSTCGRAHTGSERVCSTCYEPGNGDT